MKEWIKYEEDENEEKAVFAIHATGHTTMMLIARLLLKLVTASKGEKSVEELLTDLKVKYIPLMIIKMASEKTTHEEVTKTE